MGVGAREQPGVHHGVARAFEQVELALRQLAGPDIHAPNSPGTWTCPGLDLGNLGGLLDPSTLLGDVTALLPGLAADVPAQLATDLATAIPF